VLILDEPTSGLDPLMIEAFGETIAELARKGRTTVFLSSHVLSEVDRVCSRIALIRSGRLIAVHALDDLRRSRPRRVTVQFAVPVTDTALLPDIRVISREPACWVLEVTGPLGPLLRALAPLPVTDLSETTVPLEDIVLEMFAGAAAC
jgi:ABC-2 type transport system ATP-binding protein